jgi:hypothetical protein
MAIRRKAIPAEAILRLPAVILPLPAVIREDTLRFLPGDRATFPR